MMDKHLINLSGERLGSDLIKEDEIDDNLVLLKVKELRKNCLPKIFRKENLCTIPRIYTPSIAKPSQSVNGSDNNSTSILLEEINQECTGVDIAETPVLLKEINQEVKVDGIAEAHVLVDETIQVLDRLHF